MQRVIIASASTIAGLAALIGVKANLSPPVETTAAQPASVEAAPTGATAAGAKIITGKAVQNQYESFRVKVTIAGSKVTKVDVVDFKGDAAQTKQITSAAFPKLETAALAANSAEIDTVSGATYTSGSYKESLQSALDAAKSAPAASAPAEAAAKTVTGKAVQNQYESFQVKVTVAAKKISKVEIVDFKGDAAQTKQITSAAFPKLEKATLEANSSQIDAVSGASYTSASYKESLQSALDLVGL